MYLMSIGATLLGLLLAIGVTAIISLQQRLFARWFALASVGLALLSVAGASTIGYATTATYVLSGAAIVLDSVWIFVVSLFLWRDPTLALPSRRTRRTGGWSRPRLPDWNGLTRRAAELRLEGASARSTFSRDSPRAQGITLTRSHSRSPTGWAQRLAHRVLGEPKRAAEMPAQAWRVGGRDCPRQLTDPVGAQRVRDEPQ
jgi:hypothetical protein